MLRLRSAKTLG